MSTRLKILNILFNYMPLFKVHDSLVYSYRKKKKNPELRDHSHANSTLQMNPLGLMGSLFLLWRETEEQLAVLKTNPILDTESYLPGILATGLASEIPKCYILRPYILSHDSLDPGIGSWVKGHSLQARREKNWQPTRRWIQELCQGTLYAGQWPPPQSGSLLGRLRGDPQKRQRE